MDKIDEADKNRTLYHKRFQEISILKENCDRYISQAYIKNKELELMKESS